MKNFTEHQQIILEKATPTNSSYCINLLESNSFEEFSPLEIYSFELFQKQKKQFLMLKNINGRYCNIPLLKKIISQLQKTIKNITNNDLIELKKQQELEFQEENIEEEKEDF